MNLITSRDIIDLVKNRLPSYFDTQQVSPSVLYPKIAECVRAMGYDHIPPKETCILIENGKGKLPCDYERLCKVEVGQRKVYSRKTPNKGDVYHEEYLLEVDENVSFLLHVDKNNEVYKVVQTRSYETFAWDEFDLVEVNTTLPMSKHSPNKNYVDDGGKSISIHGDVITASFESGLLYMLYIPKAETSEGYLIPDIPKIKNWIVDACMVEAFEYLYYNNDASVYQRLQDARFQLGISEVNAASLYKLPEVQDFYDVSNTLMRRYRRRAETIVYGTRHSRYLRGGRFKYH